MPLGEVEDLCGHLVGRRFLVGRQSRIGEEQLALELAEEERLREANVRPGDQFLDLLLLLGDLGSGERHVSSPRRYQSEVGKPFPTLYSTWTNNLATGTLRLVQSADARMTFSTQPTGA